MTVWKWCRQEGWRLENENPADPNTPLVFKGVVFNEMKGAFVSQHVHAHTQVIVTISMQMVPMHVYWRILVSYYRSTDAKLTLEFWHFCVLSCSPIMSVCTASTSRTSCTQTTPTQWCRGESRWPSPTSPGSSCDSSTPHTTTQATPGRRATITIARVYLLILLYWHLIHLTSPGQDYQQPSGSTACFWGNIEGADLTETTTTWLSAVCVLQVLHIWRFAAGAAPEADRGGSFVQVWTHRPKHAGPRPAPLEQPRRFLTHVHTFKWFSCLVWHGSKLISTPVASTFSQICG